MSAEVPGTEVQFFRAGTDYQPYRQEDYQRVMGADGEYWKLGKLAGGSFRTCTRPTLNLLLLLRLRASV